MSDSTSPELVVQEVTRHDYPDEGFEYVMHFLNHDGSAAYSARIICINDAEPYVSEHSDLTDAQKADALTMFHLWAPVNAQPPVKS